MLRSRSALTCPGGKLNTTLLTSRRASSTKEKKATSGREEKRKGWKLRRSCVFHQEGGLRLRADDKGRDREREREVSFQGLILERVVYVVSQEHRRDSSLNYIKNVLYPRRSSHLIATCFPQTLASFFIKTKMPENVELFTTILRSKTN